jgi:hypothetical protein
MDTGINHRIVNTFSDVKFLDAAGAESSVKADIVRVLIPGTAGLQKAAHVAGSYEKSEASAGTKEVGTLTISGAASGVGRNEISLKIEVRSSRSEAEFSRYTQSNGKDLIFGGVVAAGADASAIAAELKKAMDARQARFGDLPFTFTVAAGVITITAKEPHITLGTPELSISDKEGQHFGATVAKAITTEAVLPQGQGSQIEENVSFLTGGNATAGSIKADERVDINGEYDEYFLSQAFSGALAPSPKAVNTTDGSAGQVDFALFVNKKLATDPKATLFESLFDEAAGSWNA